LNEPKHKEAGKFLLARAVRAIDNGFANGLPIECREFFMFCGLYKLSDANCIVAMISLLKQLEVFDSDWEKDPLSALMVDDYYFDVVSLIESSEPGFERRQLKRASPETVNLVYDRTCHFIISRINDYLEVTGEVNLWNAAHLCQYLGISASKHSEWRKEKAETRKPRPYILNMLYFLLATPIWEIPILAED
tara:strand:+ start:444 stop:1019 length:576 start_codon:yes stop_codon:yes gene_type:complete